MILPLRLPTLLGNLIFFAPQYLFDFAQVVARCGQLTIAILKSGARLDIHNIAWGRDMGESCDHITTNISPAPPENVSVDFFQSSDVVRLVEPDGTLLYPYHACA